MTPTHLDLFSGIGGFSLAAESVGFKTIGFSEIDPYASAVLKKHWPEVKNYGDIRNIKGNEFKDVTLITGGFPCQPFSVAGKKRGDSDERFLWPELARILCQVRPRFALFENVPGLLAIDGGRTFNRILSDISSVGYDCLWNLVPACAVGANHRRDRIWIVAYSRHHAGGSEFKCECESSSKEPFGMCETELADTNGIRRIHRKAEVKSAEGRLDAFGQSWSSREDVADTGLYTEGREELGRNEERSPTYPTGCSQVLDSNSQGLERQWEESERVKSQFRDISDPSWWSAEPNVGRVAHGIPKRMDRLKCLGNGIVPQVAAIFLKELIKL